VTSALNNQGAHAGHGEAAIMVHPLLTAMDMARVLGVGERSVWRMLSRANAGAVPFPRPIRIGGHVVRWRWEDVEKYLQELSGM
jgi:predicted DNA-binding transcriptional regulator AlpA